jgi:signal transduction histidine kinase
MQRLGSLAELRRRAEERLRARGFEGTEFDGPEEARRVIHELEVHQIELEMQKEELQRVRDELEASVAHSAEMYDSAPVGSATLDGKPDHRKGAFLAVLSHELRNPLAAISNAIHVLDHAPVASEQTLRARVIIERQARQLTRLVDDLLDLTRISKGKVELKVEQVDVRELVRRTLDDHRATFEQRRIALRLTEPARPVFVRGDPTRLAQVVGNLLHNAAKFTPSGGVTNIIVSAVLGRAEIRVRDSGIGIAPAQLGRLFEPFAQIDKGPGGLRGGLGVGLTLSKGLVELHDGTVTGSSEGLGRGSEFVVSLPLAPRSIAKKAAAIRMPPLRVVVLDDNLDADAAQSLESPAAPAARRAGGIDGSYP